MAKEKGFVKRKMCINGVIADVSVPINSLEKVKHLLVDSFMYQAYLPLDKYGKF